MTLASCSGLVVSYDRTTGERVWEYDVRTDGRAQSFHGELVRFGDSIFVAPDPDGGHVYRLDARTGALLWKWPSQVGVTSDLLIAGDDLVAVTEENRLSVLSLESGALRWQTEAVEASRIAPVKPSPIAVGEDLVFARSDGRISRHRRADGSMLWELQLEAGVTTDPAVFGNSLLLGSMDGMLLRISFEGEILAQEQLGMLPTYRWFLIGGRQLVGLTEIDGPERRLVAVDAVSLVERWALASPDGEGWTTAQPAVTEHGILVGNREPALYAVDPKSGELLWRASVDHAPRTVTADGKELFVGSFDGTLDLVRLP